MNRTLPEKGCTKPNSRNKTRGLLHSWALLGFILMFWAGQPLMATEVIVGGILNQNTLWSGNNTYVVIETVQVPNGITLRIEAGAVLLFNQGSGLRVEGGRLLVQGSANDSIYMLPNHHQDDSWYWKGLTISGNIKPDYIEISFTHIAGAETGITGNASNLVILQNSTINDNLLAGVVLNNASSWQIMHNRIENNIRGVEIRANNPDSQAADNILQDNFFNNDNINIYLESTNFSPCIGNIIEHNLLQGAEKGLFMFNTSQGISMDNNVERNVFFDHGKANGGFGIQSSMDQTTIRNNIFYRNPIALEINAADYLITNNSFHNNLRDFSTRENSTESTLQNNTFSSAGDAVATFLSAEGIVFSGNNISGNVELSGGIQNLTPGNISITSNFWDTVQKEDIERMLYDGNDDPALGFFEYEPFLETPSLLAPIAPPLQVFAQHIHDETRVWWRANKEENLEGYRVYFGSFVDFDFEGVLEGIVTDTVAYIPHLETSGIGVTSLNDMWNVDYAQLLGNESVYGVATFLPWAGHDASICATQALYNIQHSTAPSNTGSLSWSSSGDGAFSNPSILRPVYFPGTGDREYGMVTLTLTLIADDKSLSDSFVLYMYPKPQVNAGQDMIIAPDGLFVSNTATATNYHHLVWKSSGDGVFSHPDSLITTYQPGEGDIATGKAKLTLTAVSDYCGEVSSEINILVKNTHSVTGRVHAGNQQLTQHPVIATRLSNPDAYPKRTLTFTDNEGRFKFETLFEGEYVFYVPADTINDQLLLSAYHPAQNYWQEAFVHNLYGNISGLDIRLTPAKHMLPEGLGSISGHFASDMIRFLDKDIYCLPWFGGKELHDCEEGLSNVSVYLLGESMQIIYQHTLTDHYGHFSFRNLPFGKFVLKAEMAGYHAQASAIIELSPENYAAENINIFFSDNYTIKFSVPEQSPNDDIYTKIYPNPVQNRLFIKSSLFASTGLVHVSIYNVMGQIMLYKALDPAFGENHVSVNFLPKGFYILRIKADKHSLSETFIKN